VPRKILRLGPKLEKTGKRPERGLFGREEGKRTQRGEVEGSDGQKECFGEVLVFFFFRF
jgi:hypothetical protein